MTPRRNVALGIVFLTVFLDLIGFGIVLPLLPFFATSLGASAFEIGLIIASYSAMQFVFSPIWGRLSDRHGRRPILLIGLVGSGVSYIVFALSRTIGVLLLSRVVAGIMGANIPVAQAFIADSTDNRNRARGMGLIGAAFGLGFIVGPALGGILSRWGYALPGLVAAGLSLSNAIAAFVYLPESYPPDRRRHVPSGAGTRAIVERLAEVQEILGRVALREPIVAFFIATLGFAAFTATFPLFLDEPLGLSAVHAGAFFAVIGLIAAGVQGGLIGPVVERFGERRTAAAGGLLLGSGLFVLAVWNGLGATLALLLPIGGGWGLVAPSLQSLVSRRARPEEQGRVLGVNQSMSSAARVVGPIAGGWLFGAFGYRWQFLSAGALLLLCASWILAMGDLASSGSPD
ncbi:MAG: MFS transporter [Gemmatimonadota bacterium]